MSEIQIKGCVYRLVVGEQKSKSIGTAFAVSENTLLTCHHVVTGRKNIGLVDTFGRLIPVVTVLHPPQPQVMDVAILRIDETLTEFLPLTLCDDGQESYHAAGFIAGDEAVTPSLYQFEHRGRKDVKYGQYQLPEVIEVVGDRAGPGMSGSPFYDARSNNVIAMICGGKAKEGRTWAYPFNRAISWLELKTVYLENDRQLSKLGNGVNLNGALDLCKAKSTATLTTYERAQKYDQSRNVDRVDIQQALVDFSQSDKNFMALVGDANVGKSWVLCDYVKKHLDTQAIVLINTAFEVHLDTQLDPEMFLEKLLTSTQQKLVNNNDCPLLLTEIAKVCSAGEKPLLVIFDGVNEIEHFNRFSSHWLPQLVGVSVEFGIKVVISCRSERWISIHNHLRPFVRHFYQHRHSVPSEGGVKERAEDYFQLDGFNPQEAKQAIERYQLAETVLPVLGNHPLSYKMATEIKVEDDGQPIGRYDLLMRFIKHQLSNAAEQLRLPNYHSLWTDIKTLANNSEAYTAGLINWSNAYKLVDRDILNALLNSGLLISDEQSVKFTYDEVADALQDVAENWQAPLLSKPGEFGEAIDSGVLYNVLLRLEYEQSQSDSASAFTQGIEQLCHFVHETTMIAVNHRGIEVWPVEVQMQQILPVLILAGKIAAVLPKNRSKQILALLDVLTEASGVWYLLGQDAVDLAKWIDKSALDDTDKCHLLLDILYLEDSWPLRLKDWEEESRRKDFLSHVSGGRFSGYIASKITQLYRQQTLKVMPFLIARLGDDTQLLKESGRRRNDKLLHGEATVNSACCGILSLTEPEHVPELLKQIINRNWAGAYELKKHLFQNHNQVATNFVVSYLSEQSPGKAVWQMLNTHLKSFNDEQQQKINRFALKYLDNESSRSDILKLLRVLEPDNSGYWKALIQWELESQGFFDTTSLSKIPDGCIQLLRQYAKKHSYLICETAMFAVRNHVDDRKELLDLVLFLANDCGLLEKGNYNLGSLCEIALHRNIEYPTKFNTWLPVIAQLARHSAGSVMRNLLYGVLHEPKYYDQFQQIVEALKENPDLLQEATLIAERLSVNFHPLEHRDVFIEFRQLDKEIFDKQMYLVYRMSYQNSYQPMLDFWQSLPENEQSEISTTLLRLSHEEEFDLGSYEILEVLNQKK